MIPAGIFKINRARAKTVKVKPTTEVLTPKLLAYRGRTGPTTP
jgi:hypothetical protein